MKRPLPESYLNLIVGTETLAAWQPSGEFLADITNVTCCPRAAQAVQEASGGAHQHAASVEGAKCRTATPIALSGHAVPKPDCGGQATSGPTHLEQQAQEHQQPLAAGASQHTPHRQHGLTSVVCRKRGTKNMPAAAASAWHAVKRRSCSPQHRCQPKQQQLEQLGANQNIKKHQTACVRTYCTAEPPESSPKLADSDLSFDAVAAAAAEVNEVDEVEVCLPDSQPDNEDHMPGQQHGAVQSCVIPAARAAELAGPHAGSAVPAAAAAAEDVCCSEAGLVPYLDYLPSIEADAAAAAAGPVMFRDYVPATEVPDWSQLQQQQQQHRELDVAVLCKQGITARGSTSPAAGKVLSAGQAAAASTAAAAARSVVFRDYIPATEFPTCSQLPQASIGPAAACKQTVADKTSATVPAAAAAAVDADLNDPPTVLEPPDARVQPTTSPQCKAAPQAKARLVMFRDYVPATAFPETQTQNPSGPGAVQASQMLPAASDPAVSAAAALICTAVNGATAVTPADISMSPLSPAAAFFKPRVIGHNADNQSESSIISSDGEADDRDLPQQQQQQRKQQWQAEGESRRQPRQQQHQQRQQHNLSQQCLQEQVSKQQQLQQNDRVEQQQMFQEQRVQRWVPEQQQQEQVERQQQHLQEQIPEQQQQQRVQQQQVSQQQQQHPNTPVLEQLAREQRGCTQPGSWQDLGETQPQPHTALSTQQQLIQQHSLQQQHFAQQQGQQDQDVMGYNAQQMKSPHAPQNCSRSSVHWEDVEATQPQPHAVFLLQQHQQQIHPQPNAWLPQWQLQQRQLQPWRSHPGGMQEPVVYSADVCETQPQQHMDSQQPLQQQHLSSNAHLQTNQQVDAGATKPAGCITAWRSAAAVQRQHHQLKHPVQLMKQQQQGRDSEASLSEQFVSSTLNPQQAQGLPVPTPTAAAAAEQVEVPSGPLAAAGPAAPACPEAKVHSDNTDAANTAVHCVVAAVPAAIQHTRVAVGRRSGSQGVGRAAAAKPAKPAAAGRAGAAVSASAAGKQPAASSNASEWHVPARHRKWNVAHKPGSVFSCWDKAGLVGGRKAK